jgi:hypothetical protein
MCFRWDWRQVICRMAHRGEASFNGQQNSLWLYQNDIGGTVHRNVQNCLGRRNRNPSMLRLAS